MHCRSCGKPLEFVGTDHEGAQCFACHHPSCVARYQSVRRWWESGTDFSLEDVSPPEEGP
jgi:hypothetical protein